MSRLLVVAYKISNASSNLVSTTVPDATIRMTEVLHIMVFRTYTLRVDKGKTITLASVKNSDILERQKNGLGSVMVAQ